MGKRRGACRVLVGGPEGKRLLGRRWCRREITLNRILQSNDERAWTVLNDGPGKQQVSGGCEKGKGQFYILICTVHSIIKLLSTNFQQHATYI
jgi:hypothetical protein